MFPHLIAPKQYLIWCNSVKFKTYNVLSSITIINERKYMIEDKNSKFISKSITTQNTWILSYSMTHSVTNFSLKKNHLWNPKNWSNHWMN